LADLGLPNASENPDHLVFAIVTRDRISQFTTIGSPIAARGICWTDQNGLVGETGVADDWRLGNDE
jgi:hypothetical protein